MEAQKLENQMKKLKAQNENAQGTEDDSNFNFGGLWKRAKGQK
jgi:hypothetical protein